jgi:hypothetical protein
VAWEVVAYLQEADHLRDLRQKEAYLQQKEAYLQGADHQGADHQQREA